MAQFIKESAEYGLEFKSPRLLPMAYNFVINAAKRMTKEILQAYPDHAKEILNYEMTKERVKDMSLVFDELIDAENIDELLELIKKHKKV